MRQRPTALRFKRTLARVVAVDGVVTYCCMACVRQILLGQALEMFQRGQAVMVSVGMFRSEWVMVQGFQPCSVCES